MSLMTAKDYPVTTPYGKVAGYPLNNGFHNGVDYGCPEGTPIVVNGVLIGLSGQTGYATGPHLHVGRWVGGQVTNPGVGGGFSVSGARVSQVSQDITNGKFVRLQDADGSSWVYLHMSDNSKVKVGDVLSNLPQYNQGEDTAMPTIADQNIVDSLANAYLDDNISKNPSLKMYIGMPVETVIGAFNGAGERNNYLTDINDARAKRAAYFEAVKIINELTPKAEISDKLSKQIDDLTAKNQKLADQQVADEEAGKGFFRAIARFLGLGK